MRFVDDLVLARLRSNPNLHVHDGQVGVRKDPQAPVVIEVDLPYIHYTSAVGDDDNLRLGGRRQRRSVPFYLTYVGLTREQTKAVGEAARSLLERWVPTMEDHVFWPCRLELSTRVFRDDDAVNPEGKSLFYGRDEYAVSVMLAPMPAAG